MSNDNRIKATAVDISYKSTQDFFDERASVSYINPLSATMYQDSQPDLVVKRDSAEKNTLAQHLSSQMPKNIIELGCGIGRWSWFFAEISTDIQYLGIDFSEALINKANEHARHNQALQAKFQVMSVIEMNDEDLLLSPPFDLIIISGLLIYLNDADCRAVLKNAARLCSRRGRIYLREPVATHERLTLKDFYSVELKQRYSAIYRTAEELDLMLDSAFPSNDFLSLRWQSPFGDDLANRKETHQLYKMISRKEG